MSAAASVRLARRPHEAAHCALLRLGRLADDGQTLLFEYSPEALSQGLELSPLHLKLRADAYGGIDAWRWRLDS